MARQMHAERTAHQFHITQIKRQIRENIKYTQESHSFGRWVCLCVLISTKKTTNNYPHVHIMYDMCHTSNCRLSLSESLSVRDCSGRCSSVCVRHLPTFPFSMYNEESVCVFVSSKSLRNRWAYGWYWFLLQRLASNTKHIHSTSISEFAIVFELSCGCSYVCSLALCLSFSMYPYRGN